ncbi:MAG TPA: DUF4129 domain-containing protein, partial [Epsilonproteobacteria bacterium]|nr:DUF4129 domain-containing protein [Campylobacterota bacterium]
AVVEAASRIDVRRNPRSYALAQQIAQRYPDMQQRADAMAERFRAQALRYTLQPKPLDLHHSVDSFLFDKREGYCVHFAASFVLFARMAGVPARVITGYKGDLANSVKNYLIIKEKDAHAWAELLIDGAWQRVETTAFASKVSADRGTQSSQDDADTQGSLLLKKINLYLMYIKYEIETWILHYSHFRQMQLLEEARKNPGFLLKFLLAIVLLLLLVIVAIRVLRRPSCSDRVLCTMRPLLAALRKQGYEREDGETMHAFLCRYLDDFPQCREIAEIDRLYERIRYGGEDTTGAHLRLQEEIRLATIRSGRA